MYAWIQCLRLPICVLASALTVTSFRIVGQDVPWAQVAAVFCIAVATMLQNDWRDRVNDTRKGKRLAFDHPEAFLGLLLVFWSVSVGLILSVAHQSFEAAWLLSAMALAGIVYSETRQIPLVPVVIVSLTSASSTLLPVASDAHSEPPWLLFLSAALVIFAREIINDLEDTAVDRGYKWTIPLAIGEKRARRVAAIVAVAGFIAVVRVSLAAIPTLLVASVGVGSLICNTSPSKSRLYLDVGLALTMLTLIIIG